MSRPLTQWTNDELWDHCRRRPWERHLGSAAAIVALAVPAFFLIAGAATGHLLLAAVAALPLFLSVILGSHEILGLRTRRHEAELERRLGRAHLDHYLPEASARLREEEGPAFMVLCQGRALPIGITLWVRIELWEPEPIDEKPRGRLRCVRAPNLGPLLGADDRLPRPDRDSRIASSDAELTPAQCRHLLGLCQGPPLCPPSALVIDGYPCRLWLVRRGSRPLLAESNLASVEPAEETLMTEVLKLAEARLERMDRLLDPPLRG